MAATYSSPSQAGALPEQQVSRDVSTDFLKAAAIVGVVCIHAGVAFNEVFRFCVPAFVGLWAFYAEKAMMRRARAAQRSYLRRRWIELAVPYLFWTILYIWIFHSGKWVGAPLHTIVGGWFGGFGWAGQYYFVILFQLIVLFPLLRRVATEKTTLALVLATSLLNLLAAYWLFHFRIVGGIGDRLFVYWLPFVFAGIAFARGSFDGNPTLLVLLAVLMLCGAPFEARLGPATPYLSATNTFASLCLLAAAVFADRRARTVPTARRDAWIAQASSVIGRNTFAIFVGNVLAIEIANRIGLKGYLEEQAGQGGALLVAAFAIIASLCMGWLLQSMKLGMLVGKN